MWTIKPLGSYVLLEILETKTQNEIQLDTPEAFKVRPFRGLVREVSEFLNFDLQVKEGEVVIFLYLHGQRVFIADQPDKHFMLIHIDNIIGKEVFVE
ncbi:MAG: co-chaperone GroES [Planctomycetes bacterium]|nr:co-chaperone GroES [Planctomycetota bacterium]